MRIFLQEQGSFLIKSKQHAGLLRAAQGFNSILIHIIINAN